MENRPPEDNGNKINLIVAIVLTALGAVALGLSFTVLGKYSLIACMMLEVIAVTFINLQQKKEKIKWILYLKIGAYVLFAAAIVMFALGAMNL